jgi:hypothetical protein
MKDHVWAVICFGFGILVGCNSHEPTMNEEKPIPPLLKLTPPPVEAFTPEAASLSPKEMCDEWNVKNSHASGYDMFKSYTSRYDPTVNVCYIRSQTVGGLPPSESEVVYDGVSKRVYAQFLWLNSHPDIPGFNPPPTTCEIHIPRKLDQVCKSKKEFDELTEKYLVGRFTKWRKPEKLD